MGAFERQGLQALLDFSDDALCLFERETLTLRVANAAATKLLPHGSASNAIESVTLQDLMTSVLEPQSEARVEHWLERCLKGQQCSYNSRNACNGSAVTLTAEYYKSSTSDGILVKVKPQSGLTSRPGAIACEFQLILPHGHRLYGVRLHPERCSLADRVHGLRLNSQELRH
jgi:hypothetical protein